MEKRRLLSRIALSLILLAICCGPTMADPPPGGTTGETSQENSAWQKEFGDLTSKTLAATTLGNDELLSLVERCRAIRPVLETLPETPRKIYVGRLEKAEKLFIYVLGTRQDGEGSEK